MTNSPRKPGAQPKNKNALKHGIYSQFILLADVAAMQDMSDENPKDDLAISRVNFVHALQERNNTEDTKEKLSWDFAASYWLDKVINIKLHAREVKETTEDVWDKFIDAVRAANDRQGWKR